MMMFCIKNGPFFDFLSRLVACLQRPKFNKLVQRKFPFQSFHVYNQICFGVETDFRNKFGWPWTLCVFNETVGDSCKLMHFSKTVVLCSQNVFPHLA